MKKKITVLLAAVLVSVHCFAAEFILAPTVGLSNTTSTDLILRMEGVSANSHMNHMSIGITLGLVADNGFTFMVNNDLSLFGEGKMHYADQSTDKTFPITLKNGFFFEQSFVFGHSFKLANDRLFINLGLGFASGSGKTDNVNVSDKLLPLWTTNTGIPLQAGVQFFFTKNIGINLTMNEIPSFDLSFAFDENMRLAIFFLNFTNLYYVKLGPVFKF